MIRFRRSIKFGPLRFHLGTRGVGVSAKVKGMHVGLHATTGRPYVSFGLPGTGIYAQQDLGAKK